MPGARPSGSVWGCWCRWPTSSTGASTLCWAIATAPSRRSSGHEPLMDDEIESAGRGNLLAVAALAVEDRAGARHELARAVAMVPPDSASARSPYRGLHAFLLAVEDAARADSAAADVAATPALDAVANPLRHPGQRRTRRTRRRRREGRNLVRYRRRWTRQRAVVPPPRAPTGRRGRDHRQLGRPGGLAAPSPLVLHRTPRPNSPERAAPCCARAARPYPAPVPTGCHPNSRPTGSPAERTTSWYCSPVA